jgi:cobalt-zinc-cadmium efflux system outer membrane protein
MSVLRAVPFGAACVFFAALASAAVPPGSVQLQDAVKAVWQASADVDAARAELDAARARARAAAQPIYNPALNVEAENADVDRRTVGLSLPLDLSGKRRARAAQGSAELRVSEAAYAIVRRDIAMRWLGAWAATALVGRQAELGERRVALMQRFDELAAKRLRVGDISSPERDLAGLALGEAQIQQATLAGNYAAARARLVAVAGDATVAPAMPVGLPPASVTPLATDDLPEIIQSRARQATAEAAATVARRNRVPDPTLSLTGGRVRAGSISDRVIGVNLSIALPVLNSGQAEVDAAQADIVAADASLRASRLGTRAALMENLGRYQALRGAAAAFRMGRSGAFEDRVQTLEKLWQAGEISTSDYLVQLKQSMDTAVSGLELESQLWQSWFDYLNAAGRLTDWLDDRLQESNR